MNPVLLSIDYRVHLDDDGLIAFRVTVGLTDQFPTSGGLALGNGPRPIIAAVVDSGCGSSRVGQFDPDGFVGRT